MLRRRFLAPGSIIKSLHRCALFMTVLSLAACASSHQKEAPRQEPAARATKPPVPSKYVAATQDETIPPEPPLPVEESPLVRPKKGGKGYHVRGKTYYPFVTAKGYEERGVACWYGPSFNGHKTSNGEVFNMYGISAAHKLLPLNTNVQVTNLENGKSITLKINDRGPFVAGRVLDLSYGAARCLDMAEKGLARVRIRTCGTVEGQKKNDIVGDFFVHIGSFEKKADAIYLLEDMKSLGYKPWLLKVIRADRDDAVLWRVELGPYRSMSLADKAHSNVVKEYASAFVVAK